MAVRHMSTQGSCPGMRRCRGQEYLSPQTAQRVWAQRLPHHAGGCRRIPGRSCHRRGVQGTCLASSKGRPSATPRVHAKGGSTLGPQSGVGGAYRRVVTVARVAGPASLGGCWAIPHEKGAGTGRQWLVDRRVGNQTMPGRRHRSSEPMR